MEQKYKIGPRGGIHKRSKNHTWYNCNGICVEKVPLSILKLSQRTKNKSVRKNSPEKNSLKQNKKKSVKKKSVKSSTRKTTKIEKKRDIIRSKPKSHFSSKLYSVGAEGGISGEVTHGSLMKLVDMIPDSFKSGTFVDIGAGRGNVLLSVWYGAKWTPQKAIGYEISKRVANMGQTFIQTTINNRNGLGNNKINLLHKDVFDLQTLPSHTDVVYSFNRGMPADLQEHIEDIITASKTVKYVFVVDPFENSDNKWSIVGKQQVSQSGSGRKHTFTLYKRI